MVGSFFSRVDPSFTACLFGPEELCRAVGASRLLAGDPHDAGCNVIINPFQILCALGLALLARRPTRFVDVFRASFLLPMTVSIALTSIIWSIMLDPTLGPVNGFLRWLGVPAQPFFRSPDQALGMFDPGGDVEGGGLRTAFLLAGLLAIPKQFDESAAIDGASAWMFPLCRLPRTAPSARLRAESATRRRISSCSRRSTSSPMAGRAGRRIC